MRRTRYRVSRIKVAHEDLGVDYEVRQTLLGHRMPGMTANYSHGGPGWNRKLRAAVEMLENNYNF